MDRQVRLSWDLWWMNLHYHWMSTYCIHRPHFVVVVCSFLDQIYEEGWDFGIPDDEWWISDEWYTSFALIA